MKIEMLASKPTDISNPATAATTRPAGSTLEINPGESRLWAALASISDALLVTDEKGRLVDINAAFATFHRFDSREAAAARFAEYPKLMEVYADSGEMIAPADWAVPRALRGETMANIDCVVKRLDTGDRWDACYSFAPIRGDDGSIVGAVVTARDITLRKGSEAAARAAKQELEESNRLLALGERLATIGTWHFDAVNPQLEWSEGMYRIQGLPIGNGRPTVLTGVRIWHPADRPRHRECIETSLESGVGFSFEGRMLHNDGSVHEVSEYAQCQFDAAGRVTGLFGVVQDTNEIKVAQRRLLDANNRLIAATQAGRVGIWEISCIDGAISTDGVTRQICGLGGTTVEPEAAAWWAIVVPEDRERFELAVERCIAGSHLESEFRIARPDGTIRHLETRAGLISDAQGRPLNVLGTLWDVTETHALNAQLKEEKHRAEQANLAKSNFLAMMSHEIRTPMNGIIGMNQLLRDSELTPRQRFYADTIHDSSGALLRIMDSILDLSKLEAGKLSLEIASFDLQELIEQSVTAFSPAAEAKGLALTAEIAVPRPGLFQGDSAILRQVLLNLVSNAIKFTESGAVTIVATGSTLETGEARLRIEVRDSGIGIPEAARSKLFNPFEQLDSTITRRFGGTGLGLSISKRLLELMDGAIGVEANSPSGSVFWFELVLPRAPVAEPAPMLPVQREREPAAVSGSGSGHILVAEDNRINATVVSAFLAAGGYTYDLAADGLEAIAAVQNRHYDLVLMDVQMPTLDGLSATRQIRELPAGEGLPIVAMTANAMKEDRALCLAAGMNDYMAKPLDRVSLYATLARWIGQSGRGLAH